MRSNESSLNFQDLTDFRIPIEIFKEYSDVMKALNEECQSMFLKALGINVEMKNQKIEWEQFIHIYCLLKYDTATPQEYHAFLIKVFDPNRSPTGLIAKD